VGPSAERVPIVEAPTVNGLAENAIVPAFPPVLGALVLILKVVEFIVVAPLGWNVTVPATPFAVIVVVAVVAAIVAVEGRKVTVPPAPEPRPLAAIVNLVAVEVLN
jgi:hypothetical protein